MVTLPYAHLSYSDRLFDAPTCFMCKRFPIDSNEAHYCEFRLNNRAESKRKACLRGFIPITEQEFKLKMYFKELVFKEEKWRYRYRNRAIRREKWKEYIKVKKNLAKHKLHDILYRESHKEQISKRRKKNYLENREKILKERVFRRIIRQYDPILPVIKKINYHKNKERKLSS